MSMHESNHATGAVRGRRGRWIAIGVAALVVAILAAAVPLKIHPVDAWVGGLFGRGGERGAGGAQAALDLRHAPAGDRGSPRRLPDLRHEAGAVAHRRDPQTTAADTTAMSGKAENATAGAGRGRRAEDPLLPQPDGPDDHLAGAAQGQHGHGLRAGLRGRGGRCREAGRDGHGSTRRSAEHERRHGGRGARRHPPRDPHRRLSRLRPGEDGHGLDRYGGYIEKIHVNHIGQAVRRGEPLLEIYSPELRADRAGAAVGEGLRRTPRGRAGRRRGNAPRRCSGPRAPAWATGTSRPTQVGADRERPGRSGAR